MGGGLVLGSRSAFANSSGAMAKRIVKGPDNTFFTYPHCNGFLPDGTPVLAHYQAGVAINPHREQPLDYLAFDPDTHSARALAAFPNAQIYYSVSRNGLMQVQSTRDAQVVDLLRGGPFRDVYRLEPEWKIYLGEISPDGKTLALPSGHRNAGSTEVDRCRIESIDIATGKIQTLLDSGWLKNHVHYSPYDPTWLMFCHEGRADDRIWTWNAQEAPQGRNLFNQVAPDHTYFNIGHERAMFHKPATLFVVYPASSARPKGLYEVTFDRQFKPLSIYDRYWHCNISRDGSWAVADTQGLFNAIGPLDPKWMRNGASSDVLAVNLRTGARQLLYRSHANLEHPYHPHPHISPDGRWVICNDAREKKVILIEIDQEALAAFLA